MPPRQRADGILPNSNTLRCLANAENLHEEFQAKEQEHSASGAVPPSEVRAFAAREVLQKGRPACKAGKLWYPYVPNHGPAWHYDERRSEMREEERREWERLLSQDTKAFETQIFNKSQDTQREMIKISTRQLRTSIFEIIIAVVAEQ